MPIRIFRLLCIALTFASLPLMAADISVHDVYAAAQAGHLKEAQAMMEQVLREHPNSAKAHYVEAELLSSQGRIAAARTELANAQRLDPSSSFAAPSAVQELRQRLDGSAGRVLSREPPQRSTGRGLSWGMLLMGVLLIGAIVVFVRALMQRSAQNGLAPYGAAAPGYAPPMGGPMGGMGGGLGGGILGGLATGAAVGAGMVAGEALAHNLMDGSNATRPIDPALGQGDSGWENAGNEDMGGADFGVTDNSSWDSGGGDDGSWS